MRSTPPAVNGTRSRGRPPLEGIDKRLAASPFFAGVDTARLGAAARLVTAREGVAVVEGDEDETDVIVVLHGRLRVSVLERSGREMALRDLGPGDLFGEVACFEGRPRSARVVTLTRTDLAVLPGEVFREVALTTPILAERIIVMLAGRQRELSQRLSEISSLSVLARLCRDLLRWGTPRVGRPGQLVLSPPPTNADVAARIGCRPEQVSRAINGLIGREALERSKGAIVVRNVAVIQALTHATPREGTARR